MKSARSRTGYGPTRRGGGGRISREIRTLEAPWIEGALKEYEAHRAEVLAEAHVQQQTLALGATAVGILVAGAFNVWDDRLLATIAFLSAVPLLCILILVQWAGRAYGLMRVGAYLEALEQALRDAYSAPAPILTWEQKLAQPHRTWWKPHPGWHDFGAIAVFVSLAAGAIALGAYRGYVGHVEVVVILVMVQALVVLLATIALAWTLATARQRARSDFPAARVPDG